jgi:hypothetical protein
LSLEQIRAFLEGSGELRFEAVDRPERYQLVGRTLVDQECVLNKLLIKHRPSRGRGTRRQWSGGNQNGAIMREHMGHWHIAGALRPQTATSLAVNIRHALQVSALFERALLRSARPGLTCSFCSRAES